MADSQQRPALLPIFLIVLVDVLGLTIVIPLLAIYAESLKATPLQATLLVSTFAVCQLVSGPILGSISDRVGRRPMLIVSQLGTFAGFVVMAQATSLWMLFLARILDGVTAGNLSLAQAYIADHTRPEERTKSFALIGIAFGLGFLVGPAVTAWLSGHGLATPIWAAAGLSLTSVIATTLLLREERRPVAREAGDRDGGGDGDGPGGRRLSVLAWGTYVGYFRRPRMGSLLAQFLVYMIAFSLFVGGFALFAERRFTFGGHPFTPREIGLLFAYTGFLGIILQGGLIGRLVRRFGDARLAATGFLTLGLAYLALGWIGSIPLLVVSSTVAAYGNGVLRPTLTSLVTQEAGRHEQGVVLGLTQSLSSVAAIVAPPLAGWLIGRGYLAAWAVIAGAAPLAGLAIAMATRPPARAAEHSADEAARAP